MNLDKFAADIIEGLLKDLGDTFPVLAAPMGYIEADLYGWKVARAEALADAMKGLATKLRVLEVEADIPDGMMRSLFAMNAPKKVPDWFEHTPAPGHPGPPPEVDESKLPPRPDRDADYADRKSWIDASNKAYVALKTQREEWERKTEAWRAADAAARFFQWRWAYADQMLATRNPEPQPEIVETQK